MGQYIGHTSLTDQPLRYYFECAAIALLYVFFAKICQVLAIPPGNITPVWVPSAIILTAALVRGPKIWPGIFLGAFFGNIWAYFGTESLPTMVSDITAASFNGLGDTLGALISAYLIRRYTHTNVPLLNTSHVLIFILNGAFISSAISGIFGVTPIWLLGGLGENSFWFAFGTWLIGDAVGILVFAPALLAFTQNKGISNLITGRVIALIMIIIILFVLAVRVITDHPIEIALILFFPILIWSIFFLDYRATYVALILLSSAVVLKSVIGAPAYVEPISLIELQTFLAVVAMAILFIQALVTERETVLSKLRAFQNQLQDKLTQQTLALSQSQEDIQQALNFTGTATWKYDTQTHKISWSDQINEVLGCHFKASEASPIEIKQIMHPDDFQEWQKSITLSLNTGLKHDCVFRVLDIDGNTQWIHSCGGAKKDLKGKIVYLAGLVRNITKEHLAEQNLHKTLNVLQLAVNTAKLGIWQYSINSDKLEWNNTLYQIYGISKEEFTKDINAWKRKVVPQDLAYADKQFEKILLGQSVYDVEFRINYDPHTIRHIQASGTPVFDDKHNIVQLIGINLDITHIKQREKNLAQAASVFNNTIEGIIMTDLDGTITQVNPAFETITGYLKEQAIGKNCRILRSGKHDKEFYRKMWRNLQEKGQWKGEIYNRKKTGELYPELLTISTSRDQQGKPFGYVAVFSDISELKMSQERLNYLAHHDSLTGLPNRLLFNERLKQNIRHAQRQKTKLALVFIDIDYFKQINDRLGHQAGDDLLKAFSALLKNNLRDIDTAARISGDEFVVLLENIATAEHVVLVLEKLILSLRNPFQMGDKKIRITLSMGIAVFPDDTTDAQQLMSYADAAMYFSKKSGRNCFKFYTHKLSNASKNHLKISNALQPALENESFYLMFQPQTDIKQKTMTGIEALLRWQDPKLGMLPPGQFVPIAEQAGLMNEIGKWVIQNACKTAKRLLDKDYDFGKMAINVSESQISSMQLFETLIQALEQANLLPEYLTLEVSETLLVADVENSLEQLKKIRNIGVEIAVDAFGIGPCSLRLLRKFPIDKIKIDRSIIREIPKQHDEMALTKAIVSIAEALSLNIVAQGVERPEQLEYLKNIHCPEFQGFYFSRPLAFSELKKFITNKKNPNVLTI